MSAAQDLQRWMDQALEQLLHGTEGNRDRWNRLIETGATDHDILKEYNERTATGMYGYGFPGSDARPRMSGEARLNHARLEVGSLVYEMKGATLAQAIRRIKGIGDANQPGQLTMF